MNAREKPAPAPMRAGGLRQENVDVVTHGPESMRGTPSATLTDASNSN